MVGGVDGNRAGRVIAGRRDPQIRALPI